MSTDRAGLIIKGLGPQHLTEFLPGKNTARAVARAVDSMGGCTMPGMDFCEIISEGIGLWPHGQRDRRASNATLFATWEEVLDVIRRGCEDGYREAYEAAFAAWAAATREAWAAYEEREKSGAPPPAPRLTGDPSYIRATTAALIRHGCELAPVQEALF